MEFRCLSGLRNSLSSGSFRARLFFVVLSLLFMPKFIFADSKIKLPNVSGQFYSADPKELSESIDSYFKEASVTAFSHPIDIVIAPHAGYPFSGPVAAYSFKAVSAGNYKTIIILGPSHFFGFDGISIWTEGAFQTPLGQVPVDEVLAKKLVSFNKNFYFEPRAFKEEHSVEVEIPFLQKTFKDFKIVPVVMGQASFQLLDEFASALYQVIHNEENILILVSTDMSHYHDDQTARKMDEHTLEAVKALRPEQLWQESHLRSMELCGFVPTTAALLYARRKGLERVEVLRYANSGDVTGDLNRVVGYSSVVIYGSHDERKNDPAQASGVFPLTKEEKQRLLEIAKATIEEYVRRGKTLEVSVDDPRLREEEGAFVTIHKHGQLRGCIGHIIGDGPLYLTVRDMAISAVSQDPRFTAVKPEELENLELEVSVLSKPRLINSVEEIQLGVHGVIVSQGSSHHGLFLPQVASETGWSKEEFLNQLCAQKAGLPPDAWKDPRTKIEIFTAEVFSEKEND